MRVLVCCAALAWFTFAAAAVRADGLLYQLPEDGTWARYDFKAAVAMGDKEEEMTGSMRVASVGRVTENEQPCRWIEVRFEGEAKNRPSNKMLIRALVPEKHLVKGESPLEHVLRASILEEHSKEPRKLDPPSNFDKSPLPLVLAPPVKDPKELAPAVVQSKLGKLSCKGVGGTAEFKTRREGSVSFTMENRLHPKAPFGFVSGHWAFEMKGGAPGPGKGHFDLKLADFGTGAKSDMPDQK